MTVDLIGRISLYDILWYFFIYSFLGWITEVIYAALKTGKFVNRGFLNGPVCPIYGCGMAIGALLLNVLEDKWYLLFLAGGALATVLEFITGFVLEKIFKTKWWDYSKEHFNVKGYVCLKFSLLWGIGILAVFKTLVPLTDKFISLVPYKWWGLAILSLLATVMLTDFITVIVQLKNLKLAFKESQKIAEIIKKDSDFIGEKISGLTISLSEKLKTLSSKIKSSRIIKAFPSLNKNRNKEDFDDKKNNDK